LLVSHFKDSDQTGQEDFHVKGVQPKSVLYVTQTSGHNKAQHKPDGKYGHEN
jgi:hypothetical protein